MNTLDFTYRSQPPVNFLMRFVSVHFVNVFVGGLGVVGIIERVMRKNFLEKTSLEIAFRYCRSSAL